MTHVRTRIVSGQARRPAPLVGCAMTADDLYRHFVQASPVDDRVLADFGCDDIGNAERLIARHGQDLRRTAGLGVLVFNGVRWLRDQEKAAAVLMAQATARAIRDEAKAFERESNGLAGELASKLADRAMAHTKWATASASSQRLSAMLTQAWPHLDVKLEDWNACGSLFNVENGTLDLSGVEPKLVAHRRGHLITHLAGVAYDASAECPEFRTFVDRVLPPVRCENGDDRSLQRFVQRALGACLVDSVRDQAMIVFHGAGANGKSTLLNAVARVMGSYCMTVAVQTLLYSEQSGSSASPDVARLAEGHASFGSPSRNQAPNYLRAV